MHLNKETNPKQVTFTDEQIRSKAYLISQKYPHRLPDENWDTAIQILEKQAAIETAEIEKIERRKSGKGYLRWINPMIYVGGFWSSLLDDYRREAIKVIISMFGILATASAAVGLIWTVWDATEDRKLTQKRLITDRFSKAATLLSNKDKAVRIAAIYSLERLAKDSPQDHWTVIELLSAYVLEKSPLVATKKESKQTPNSKKSIVAQENKESIKSLKPIDKDVQAALRCSNSIGAIWPVGR